MRGKENNLNYKRFLINLFIAVAVCFSITVFFVETIVFGNLDSDMTVFIQSENYNHMLTVPSGWDMKTQETEGNLVFEYNKSIITFNIIETTENFSFPLYFASMAQKVQTNYPLRTFNIKEYSGDKAAGQIIFSTDTLEPFTICVLKKSNILFKVEIQAESDNVCMEKLLGKATKTIEMHVKTEA